MGTAGSLALDFANTLDWRRREHPVELLRGFPDLLRWAWSAGVLERSEAKKLRAWAEAHRRPAARALADAIEVREAIAAIFQATLGDGEPPPKALARLESACRSAWGARALRAVNGVAAWTWREGPPEPSRPAAAAALDAARLLTSPECRRVRQCADAECGWFFLDTSRNRSRRWCSMEACGNRNKARRFYRRAAAKGGPR
ncbi:MAG TPA: ABATE domain-containing protein [Candidatus Eisenbacteria bacterium]